MPFEDFGVGVHPNVPAEEYHSWPLASSTLLNVLWNHSPAHVVERRKEPMDSRALVVGTALHTLIWEGAEKFREVFTVGGPMNDKTGKYFGPDTQKWMDWAGSLTPPVRPLHPDEFESIMGMANAVTANRTAMRAIERCEGWELSIVFRPIPELDFLCKARIDGLSTGAGQIVDLKTTRDASLSGFRHSISIYGYQRQAALYRMAAQSCDLDVHDYVFVAVEKEPPYGNQVLRLHDDDLVAAEVQILDLLRAWHECERTGSWPGYPCPATPKTIELPAYLRAQRYADRYSAPIEDPAADSEGGDW